MTSTAMTLPTASPTAPTTRSPDRVGAGRAYGRMWARFPRELGYLALTAVIGVASLTVFRAFESIGASLLAVLVGLFVFAFVLLASRYLGIFELVRLRWARMRPIAGARWQRPFAGKTFFRSLGDIFGNPHYWRYYLHAGVLNPVLAVITSVVWVGVLSAALFFSFTPLWAYALPFGDVSYFGGVVFRSPADPMANPWQLVGRTAL